MPYNDFTVSTYQLLSLKLIATVCHELSNTSKSVTVTDPDIPADPLPYNVNDPLLFTADCLVKSKNKLLDNCKILYDEPDVYVLLLSVLNLNSIILGLTSDIDPEYGIDKYAEPVARHA